jgi:hypothetical protein
MRVPKTPILATAICATTVNMVLLFSIVLIVRGPDPWGVLVPTVAFLGVASAVSAFNAYAGWQRYLRDARERRESPLHQSPQHQSPQHSESPTP